MSNAELQQEVKSLQTEVERLKGMVLLLRREKFGSKSERFENADQLIFNEIEFLSGTLPDTSGESETETVSYKRAKPGRGKKKSFPENLPREERIFDLPENEKTCPHDGSALTLIGEDRTEKLKTIPAQHSIVVEIKKKYACETCEAHMAQASANSVLPGTIATPELLAFIVYSKFFQGLPLYRLEEQFKLNGIALTRGTMARWLISLTDKLMPIYNLLQDKAFASGYMAIDATHVQVLKEKGRAAKDKSFMWARGSSELGIVLYDYDPSGGGRVAKKLVEDYRGALQADAHRGYRALDPNQILRLGCMMHSRRRFHAAFLQAKKAPGLASEALTLFKWIYDKEADYKARGLTPPERKEIRDREIGPSLQATKEWCEVKLPTVPKSSPIGNALNYFITEYPELTAFLNDGRYEIDNGWLERTIRKFAIGRNNWLFCDTVEGAHASGMLYSLAITAKLNGKNPFEALTEIFARLPLATGIEDYEVLTELLLSPANAQSCRKK